MKDDTQTHSLNLKLAEEALRRLDLKLEEAKTHVTLIVGGGGAMLLRHGYPGSTTDIDAIAEGIEFEKLKPAMAAIARDLNIAADWLNPYYQAFTLYLPSDVKTRMTKSFSGQSLTVLTLGAEDLLIMKLMAGRAKDRGHIRHLLKNKPNLSIVERRLGELADKFPKEARAALDLFDEVTDV